MRTIAAAAILAFWAGTSPSAGETASTGRPRGVLVWNRLPVEALTPASAGDPAKPLEPIRIPALRNGRFSGQVVVSSTEPIQGFKAQVTDLKGEAGVIPAAAVKVLYLEPGPIRNWHGGELYFQVLAEEPAAAVRVIKGGGAAFQPVWLKVRVPKDAKPGPYTGTLAITLDGSRPIAVPVALTVHDWALPDPNDFRTYMGCIQSPESVAMQYGVPLWSETHLELVAKSLALLSEIGNREVYLPLICRTHFGNAESWVRFVRQKDGSWKRDLSAIERYIDLVLKHQGKPWVVVLYMWERYTASGKRPPLVTELDPETGAVKEVEAPMYATPEGKAFWAPVIQELRERMRARGLEGALMLGLSSDFLGVTKEQAAFFKEIAPGMKCVAQAHGLRSEVLGIPVGYSTTVWNAFPPMYGGRRHYGWKNPALNCQYPRDIWRSRDLVPYRTAPEWNIAGQQRGMGRLGADFWPVLKSPKSREGAYWSGAMLSNRYYEDSGWAQLTIRMALLAPGPDGALSTTPFEMLREGVQDAEARIFIEQALTDAALKAKLPADLVSRCEALLAERTNLLIGKGQSFLPGFLECTERLYSAAAEVAKAIGGTSGQ